MDSGSKFARFRIPEGVRFSQAQFSYKGPGKDISFTREPIEAICRESGIDVAVFKNTAGDNTAGFLIAWYMQALKAGEEPDPEIQRLIDDTSYDIPEINN